MSIFVLINFISYKFVWKFDTRGKLECNDNKGLEVGMISEIDSECMSNDEQLIIKEFNDQNGYRRLNV